MADHSGVVSEANFETFGGRDSHEKVLDHEHEEVEYDYCQETNRGVYSNNSTGFSDKDVSEAVKKLLQGRSDPRDAVQQSIGRSTAPSPHAGVSGAASEQPATGKRSYNWNTTHFYPDVHKVDVVAADQQTTKRLHQRSRSEPGYFRSQHGGEQHAHSRSDASFSSSTTTSSSASVSSSDVNATDDEMPLRELSICVGTVHATSETRGSESLTAVIVNIQSSDSSCDSSDENSGGKVLGSGSVPSSTACNFVESTSQHICKTPIASASMQQGGERLQQRKADDRLDTHGSRLTIDLLDGGINRVTLEQRPSEKAKEMAEKRREFLKQRCRSQGWDLKNSNDLLEASATETPSPPVLERKRASISRSQDDIRYVEQAPIEWTIRDTRNTESSAPEEVHIDVKNRIRLFESSLPSKIDVTDASSKSVKNVASIDLPFIDEVEARAAHKGYSSFENIFDSVNKSEKLNWTSVGPADARLAYRKSLPSPTGVFVTSSQYLPKKSAMVEVNHKAEQGTTRVPSMENWSSNSTNNRTYRASSSLVQHVDVVRGQAVAQKSNRDAKSIVEEERLKFADYKMEFQKLRRSTSDVTNGNGSGSENEKFPGRTIVEITSKPRKAIPPDDYEYILRKIHHERPDEKKDFALLAKSDSKMQKDLNDNTSSVCTNMKLNELNNSYGYSSKQFAQLDQVYLSSKTCVRPEFEQNGRVNDLKNDSWPSNLDLEPPPAFSNSYRTETLQGQLECRPSANPPRLHETSFPMNAEKSYNSVVSMVPARSSFAQPAMSQSDKTKMVHSYIAERYQKPPVPRRDDLPLPPDSWQYNDSYELLPSFASTRKASTEDKHQIVSPNNRWSRSVKQPASNEAVNEMLKHLDDNDLPPPPLPLLHEQYRFSIQEPCMQARPEHLDMIHNVPMYKYSDSIRLQERIITAPSGSTRNPTVEIMNGSTKYRTDVGFDNIERTTVFSVTGYHNRPQQSPATTEPIGTSSVMASRVPDFSYRNSTQDRNVHWQSSSGAGREKMNQSARTGFYPQPPPQRRSEMDKRRPIVGSLEVETALNSDHDERYFYCIGEPVGEVQAPLKRGPNSSNRYCDSIDRPVYQNYTSQDNLLLSGDYGRLWSDYSSCHPRDGTRTLIRQGSQKISSVPKFEEESWGSLPSMVYQNVSVVRPHSGIERSSSVIAQENSVMENRIDLPPVQPDILQIQRPSGTVPAVFYQSPAAIRYEKHIVEAQEAHQAHRMVEFDLVESKPAKISADLQCAEIARHSQNSSSDRLPDAVPKKHPSFTVYEGNKCVSTNSRRAVMQQISSQTHQLSNVALPESSKDCVNEDESQPMSVAALKTKLFGLNEEKARQMFGHKLAERSDLKSNSAVDLKTTSSVKSCPVNQPSSPAAMWNRQQSVPDDILVDCVSPRDSQIKKKNYIQDEFTDLEKVYDNVQLDACAAGVSAYDQSRVSEQLFPAPPQHLDASCEKDLKRLSISNVKMLEDLQMKTVGQCSSLDYTKEWLASGSNQSTINAFEEKTDQGKSRRVTDDMALRKLRSGSAGRSNPDLNAPSDVAQLNNAVDVAQPNVVYKQSDQRSFVARSQARRSLPVLSDKDVERWQSILSHLPQHEKPVEPSSKLIHSISVKNNLQPSVAADKRASKPLELEASLSQQRLQSASSSRPNNHQLHSTLDEPLTSKPVFEQVFSSSHIMLEGEIHEKSENYQNIVIENIGTTNIHESLIPLASFEPVKDAAFESRLHDRTKAEKTQKSLRNGVLFQSPPETPEERSQRLQKLREQWFSGDNKRSPQPLPEVKSLFVSPLLNQKTSDAQATSSLQTGSTTLTIVSLDTKPQQPSYVSPLMRSTAGVVLASQQPSLLSSPSNLKTRLPTSSLSSSSNENFAISNIPKMKTTVEKVSGNAQGNSNETTTRNDKLTAKQPTVCEGQISEQSLNLLKTQSRPMTSPGIVHRDQITIQSGEGDESITETRTATFSIEPLKYEASRKLEKVVDQPKRITIQSESEKIRNECEVSSDQNSRSITRSVETKMERAYCMESKSRTVESKNSKLVLSIKQPPNQGPTPLIQPPNRIEPEKNYDISDGELTDATDVTLDAMVGANRSRSVTSDIYEFSDAEFLSSANLAADFFESRDARQRSTNRVIETCVRQSYEACNSSSISTKTESWSAVSSKNQVASKNQSQMQADIEKARAEMKVYRKVSKTVKQAPERTRSIKELVSSFEDMSSPFMRARPRSLEFGLDSSNSSDEDVLGSSQASISGAVRMKRKSQLKNSSSFKETSQTSGIPVRQPVTKRLAR